MVHDQTTRLDERGEDVFDIVGDGSCLVVRTNIADRREVECLGLEDCVLVIGQRLRYRWNSARTPDRMDPGYWLPLRIVLGTVSFPTGKINRLTIKKGARRWQATGNPYQPEFSRRARGLRRSDRARAINCAMT
jgi:hypothetical protein